MSVQDLFGGAGGGGAGAGAGAGAAAAEEETDSSSTQLQQRHAIITGVPSSKADIAEALAQAEDEHDRTAAANLHKEMRAEAIEFEDGAAAQAGVDDPRMSGASESESGAEEDVQSALRSQLAKLRGVERHAVDVLQRQMDPLYRRQLAEAKANAEQKDAQLKEMQDKIRAQEEALTSEDEEMLFYDKEAAKEAAKQYLSDTSAAELEVYAPPNPHAGGSGVVPSADAQRLDVYIEPSRATQYRVAFMLYSGPPRTLLPRIKRRKRLRDLRQREKRRSNEVVKRSAESSSTKHSKVDKRARVMAPSAAVTDGRGGRGRGHGTGGGGSELVAAPQRGMVSLFRKRDEGKGSKGSNKAAKHPKRPVKTSGVSKDRKEMDANRAAPSWLIEEDWALLSAVRTYLSPSGNVNWYLVADVLHMTTSFTGRVRSPLQCRDRYFSVIMPREDGKLPAGKSSASKKETAAALAEAKKAVAAAKAKAKAKAEVAAAVAAAAAAEKAEKGTKKKKKTKKEVAAAREAEAARKEAEALQKPKVLNTAKLVSLDNRQSLLGFHRDVFQTVRKLASQRQPPQMSFTDATASHEAVLQQANFNTAGGQITPTSLSDSRLACAARERQREEALRAQAQQQQQVQRARAAAAASAGRPGRMGGMGSPSAAPTPYRLAKYVLDTFQNPQAHKYVTAIYNDANKTDNDKAREITNIIQQLHTHRDSM
eukprot:UC1_evm1s2020